MKHFLFFILLLLACADAKSQRDLSFTRFSTEDNNGLSSNFTMALAQDAKGYMWIGTANGLQRFDGIKFSHITPARGSDKLPNTYLFQIVPSAVYCLITLPVAPSIW